MSRTTPEEHAVLDSGGDTVSRFLSVCPREVLFDDQITALVTDSDTGDIIALDHAVSWAGTGMQSGMTVDIGTTPLARDVGSVRLRYYNSTNYSATIAQTSLADCPIEVGHYFSVRLEYLPWHVRKRTAYTYNMDGTIASVIEYWDYDLPYDSDDHPYPPKANITAGMNTDGTPIEVKRAGWVDGYGKLSQRTYRTVTLTNIHSVIHEPGATKDASLWTWTGSATLVSGLITDDTITLQLAPGFLYVTLFYQDSTGNQAIMRIGLWTHDDSYPPLTNFAVASDETEVGRDMQLEFFGDADESSAALIPEMAHVCYWEVAEFAGGAAPHAYRDQVVGWIIDDKPLLKLNDSRYGIHLGGMSSWKPKLRTNSTGLIDTGDTPTRYTELQNITVDRGVDWSLRAVDTFRTLVNVYYSQVTAQVEALTLPQGNAWTQISESVPEALLAQALSDSYCNLWFRIPVSFLPDAGRVTRLTALALTSADWTAENGLELPTGNVKAVGIVNASAEMWDGDSRILYLSIAPSKTPGAGVGTAKMPALFLQPGTPQAVIDLLCGLFYAHENNPRPNVTLVLCGNLDVVEPAWGEPVSLTWTEDTVRGTVLNEALFILKRVSVAHTNEPDERTPPKVITWTLEQVTTGAPGKTVEATQLTDVTQPPDDSCDVTAGFTADDSACPVIFTNTSTGDQLYGYSWDFGDGSVSIAQTPAPHAYAVPGTYTVTLTVLSECGATDTYSADVNAVEDSITAGFTWEAEGARIAFTDTSSGDNSAAAFAWDFGDGSSTEQNPIHIYVDADTYTVTQTVTSPCGATDTFSDEVTPTADMLPIANYDFIDEACSEAAKSFDDSILLTNWVTNFGGSWRGQYVPLSEENSAATIKLNACAGDRWLTVTEVRIQWRFNYHYPGQPTDPTWYVFRSRTLDTSDTWSAWTDEGPFTNTHNSQENQWLEHVFPIASVDEVKAVVVEVQILDVGSPFNNAAEYIYIGSAQVSGTQAA